jgi:hypothetical protein
VVEAAAVLLCAVPKDGGHLRAGEVRQAQEGAGHGRQAGSWAHMDSGRDVGICAAHIRWSAYAPHAAGAVHALTGICEG